MDPGITRRRWLASMASFATYAFVGEVGRSFAGQARGASRWVDGQADIALALKHGELRPSAWMDEVDRLSRETDLAELMALVRGSRISPAPDGGSNDPRKRFVHFVDEGGRPRRLPYATALFAFTPDNVITPHGHKHMVSAHLVVEGRFRIRTFDRVDDEPGAMLIRPREDRIATTGEVSTMSSERGNVHWFVPHGGAATTFDVIVSGLDAGAPDHDIEAIDPLHGERRGDGVVAAPIIGFERAARLYTRDV
jgi:hypothetical protein